MNCDELSRCVGEKKNQIFTVIIDFLETPRNSIVTFFGLLHNYVFRVKYAAFLRYRQFFFFFKLPLADQRMRLSSAKNVSFQLGTQTLRLSNNNIRASCGVTVAELPYAHP